MALSVDVLIGELLQKIWPQVSEEDKGGLVSHLISLGVTCLADLKFFSDDLWPTTIEVPVIRKKQLLSAFHNISTDPLPQPPAINHTPVQAAIPPAVPSSSRYRTATNSDVQRRQFFTGEYWYDIPWALMPKHVLLALDESKRAQTNVNPELIMDLKKAIRPKLVEDYKMWKSTRAEAQKHPGRRVYNNIGFQIQDRYGDVVKSLVQVPGTGKGLSFFARKMEISVENNMKAYDCASRKRKAVMKRDTAVGIIAQEYDPGLDAGQKNRQELTRVELQNIFELEPCTPWEQVREKMEATYELQRCHILEAKLKAECEENLENKRQNVDNEAENEDDVVQKTSSEELKDMWPFLFTADGLILHHQRLTGRNLQQSLQVFSEGELERLLQFLITSTNTTATNVENLIVMLKVEAAIPPNASDKFETSIKILGMVEMLSRYFKEDVNKLVIPVEKTSESGLLKFSVLKDPAPCIVAFDVDKFAARRYCVCADKTVLVETDNGADAILALFNLCFCLHLEYPALKHTMEFIERYVLGMPIGNTNVKAKNGSQIVVTSASVQNLILYFECFCGTVANKL